MASVRRIQKEKELLAQGLIKPEDLARKEKNKICGFSSAYFQFNHMYKTICNYRELAADQIERTGRSDYAVYVFNHEDAPEGFFDNSMIQHAKATSSEIAFAMEYMSIFPSDSDGFFKRSLIDSCKPVNGFSLELKGDKDAYYFIGIDPARNQDNFGINIVKVKNGEMRMIRVISFSNTAFPEITKVIRGLLHDYNVIGVYVDAGGGGLSMKDLLGDPNTAGDIKEVLLDKDDESTIGRAGSRILTMVNFAPKWISDANFEMRSSMEHKKFLFPDLSIGNTFIRPEYDSADLEDEIVTEYFKMLDELQSVIMTATKTGVLHFDTPKGSRKDRYSALLLAHKAAYDFITASYQVRELPSGGTMGPGGLQFSSTDTEYDGWQESAIIDRIAKAKQGRPSNFGGAALQ